MKYLKQFGIILAFSFAGELLHAFIPLPIPASIYGIILLFLALQLKLIKVESIREVSTLLIQIMPVMFIPAAVGLMEMWGIIQNRILIYIVILAVTTFVVMIVSGRVTQAVIRRDRKRGQDDE